MKLYVVMDGVARESGPVFEAKNDGVAWRQFEQLTEKSSYPDDFELVCVGEIDHSTNIIVACEPEVVYGLT